MTFLLINVLTIFHTCLNSDHLRNNKILMFLKPKRNSVKWTLTYIMPAMSRVVHIINSNHYACMLTVIP